MGEFSVYEIVLVSAILLTNIALIWAVLTKSRVKNLGESLSAFIILISLWIVSAYLSELIQPLEFKLLFTKFAYFGGTLAIPVLVKFLGDMQSDTSLNKKWVSLLLIIPGLAFGAGIIFSNRVIESIRINSTSFDVIFGNLSAVYDIYLVFNLFLVSYLLIRGYRKSTGESRRAYQFLLIGIGFFVITNVIVNVILPFFLSSQSYYRIGNYSVIIFIVLTSYAIITHHLFDIRTLVVSILSIVINVVLIAQIFLSDNFQEQAVKIIIALIVAVGSYSLVKNISSEIFRREEVEKLAKERIQALKELEQRNKNLAALQKISQLVLNENELQPMVQKILNEIPKQLDSSIGALLNLAKQGHLVGYSITQTEFSKKIFSLVGGDLERYSEPIDKDFNLLHKALVENVVKESDRLSDFVSPPIAKSVALTLEKTIGMKFIIGIPLYASQEPLGVMMFAFRLPKDELNDKDIEMAQAIADDMSLAIQRAEAYQKLKDANTYLAQLDKMKDEFISMASHELNTPLAAIEGYLSMILDEGMGKVDAKSKIFLGRAYESSKRLADLILDLLNVSRIEQGRLKMKFSQANFVDLAQSVIHELQIKSDAKKLYLKLDVDKKKVPAVWCDADRIREVIVNLVGNAIKFTEKGGITIKVSTGDNKILTEVIDTGRGIAKEDQNKLFQKFSQIHREIDEQKGTGLGLYISRNFVELHKGRLTVKSDEGKGSTFGFEIPIIAKPPVEVKGAMLEGNLAMPRIEAGAKELPASVTAVGK